MTDDFGWEREWPQFEEYLILDGGLDHRTSVDECPRCAAIVRTENRSKHEVVCWGPDIGMQIAGVDYPTEYMITAKGVVGYTEKTVAIMVTREFLTDSERSVSFVLASLDRQITEARKGLG